MSDDDTGARVRANEPVRTTSAGVGPKDSGTAHGQVSPAAANEEANATDEDNEGDGVAFFEGGDGREEARDDIERSG